MTISYKKYTVPALLIGVPLVLGLIAWQMWPDADDTNTSSISATYTCDNGKTIDAVYTNNTKDRSSSNVALSLSDERQLVLPIATSASGARYANDDESIVFWNKGNTAFITEGKDTTFANCTGVITASSTDTGSKGTPSTTTGGKAPTPLTPKTSTTYTNNVYHFALSYNKNLHIENNYTPFHNLANNWRLNAPLNNQGTALIEIPIVRFDHGGIATGQPYPLYYTSVFRVGVSPDVAKCYDTDAGYTNQPVNEATYNGITWKVFTANDAAMMQYINAKSYRTIHNKMCYVAEALASGSSYKDDTMKAGLTQTELDQFYNQANAIIKTFTFIK